VTRPGRSGRAIARHAELRELSSNLRMPHPAVYVYCVIEGTKRPSHVRVPPGVPGATAPEALPLGRNLWCAVSDVSLSLYGPAQIERGLRDLQWVADVALAHEAVVEHFARQRGATVVPMKLFTIFHSRDRVAAEMSGRRPQLRAVLRRIRGCEEWSIRIRPLPRTASSSSPVASTTRGGRGGAAFLLAKKQARDQSRELARQAADAAASAYTALAPLVREARVRDDVPESASTPPLLEAAFLVPDAGRSRFKAAARKAASRCRTAGAELTLSGPWPAYNFVQFGGRLR
jgi:gas vesicle protein GvpL/GvpF